MTAITIHLDGERLEIPEGTRLGEIIPVRDPRCSVAVIRPASRETEQTSSFRVLTSRGEIKIEPSGRGAALFASDSISELLPYTRWLGKPSRWRSRGRARMRPPAFSRTRSGFDISQ